MGEVFLTRLKGEERLITSIVAYGYVALLVLCASNEDHSVVEPLLPPTGAKPGERVSFSGYII
ncbi:hypothetical protein F2Q69_00054666 [Brassica cretica]|uniref:Uncharacterized protein n=1 Tax=Brassica cretica TaxID=69181 RepID=A0A8S9MV77_BRACR|nr:hypothetical protein F2Q69_00054666 [Brassica cretica]